MNNNTNVQSNPVNVQSNPVNVQVNKNNQTKQKRYKYKVKDQEGKQIESYFDADKRTDVESFLANKGYKIISIEEDKLSSSLGLTSAGYRKRMNSKDLNFFLTQLSTYVKAGIPLVDSMDILSNQAKNKNIQVLYKKIVFELNRGVPFSACLEKQGNIFPKMLVNMLKTSEMTGDLTGVLDDMAAHYKQQDSNRKQIINAMTYPSVLLIFAIAVLTFVITYIVPQFTSMYESTGSTLPKLTLVIMDISQFIIDYWMYILLVLIVIAGIFTILFKKVSSFKFFVQTFLMHIPVVKDLIIYNQLVLFTSTFSALIRHDVFITDSMDILSKITENEIYKDIIKKAIENLSKGNGVSVAFKGHWAFPDTAYQMLVTGEKTGKLGEMLQHVAEYFSEEQTNLISRMKSLVEPIMIILLAALVGIILLAVVYPMFGFYSTVM